MKTQNIVVAVNFTDKVGQDGDWQEAATGAEVVDKAKASLSEMFTTEQADELFRDYEIVNLNAAEVQEINDSNWASLVRQWRLARANGWTSAEADALMAAEIARRA